VVGFAQSQEFPVTLSHIAQTIAVEENPATILQAAVDGAYEALQTDVTFGAVASTDRSAYLISAMHGAFGRRFREIVIPPTIGLGGRVAIEQRPMAVHDYLTDPSITKHFVDIVVGEERLRGIACVPVSVSTGVEALLYAGLRSPGYLSGRALETLEHIANYAGIASEQALAQSRREELGLLRERQRIATALHDSVAQSLFTIGVEARRSHHAANPQQLIGALREIEELAGDARRELREALHRINAVPESLALEAVLEAEARLFQRAANCTIRVVRSGTSRSLPEAFETLICDAVREGMRNAVKHTNAKLIVVHVSYDLDEVRATVQADGRPSPASDDLGEPEALGCGLALLRERAAAVRGVLELELGEDGETVLRLRLPAPVLAQP
jgi:signal transduction histidine kinase